MKLNKGDIFYHSQSKSWLDHGAIWRYIGNNKCILIRTNDNNHPWRDMSFVGCDTEKDDIRIIHLDNPMFKEIYDLYSE